jgi:hypothetical protein
MNASKLIFSLSHQNDRAMQKLSANFNLKVVWSGSDTGGLHATHMSVVAETEIKHHSIWGFAIRPKCTIAE